jgi:hypothetical protein
MAVTEMGNEEVLVEMLQAGADPAQSDQVSVCAIDVDVDVGVDELACCMLATLHCFA